VGRGDGDDDDDGAGLAGTMQSDDVDGFPCGQTRYCVLRGADPRAD
jgi:hypothetical protein